MATETITADGKTYLRIDPSEHPERVKAAAAAAWEKARKAQAAKEATP